MEFNFDCVYLQFASTSNIIVGKEYLAVLEDRLQRVEKEIVALRATHAPQDSSKRLQFEDDANREGDMSNGSGKLANPSDGSDDNVEVGVVGCQDEGYVDEMAGGLGAVVFSAEEDTGYFGPSSNVAFMRHISRAVTSVAIMAQPWLPHDSLLNISRGVLCHAPSRRSSPSLEPNTTGHTSVPNINIFALPPEAKVRKLVAIYFADTGLLFPYLHEPSFWTLMKV